MAKKKRSAFAGKTTANAHKQRTQASKYGYLNLPKGVQMFKEDPDSRAKLDFLPYKVTSTNHPDRDDELGIATPDSLWYKKPFRIHRNVGVKNDSEVCLAFEGRKCPICEYRARRAKEGAEYAELKELNASLRNLYVVVPKDAKKYEEKPHIWDISQFLFQDMLNAELEEDEDYGVFPDLEEGLTLRIRFGSGQIGTGKPFAETSRIDFTERDGQYDESILDKVPNLDDILDVKSYAKLEALFLELDDPEIDESDKIIEEEEEVDEKPKRKPEPKLEPDPDEKEEEERPKRKPKPKLKPDPDEEEEEDEKPKRKPKSEPKKTKKTADDRCPFGHHFGTDCEEYDDCNECDEWDDCMDAKEEMK